MERGESQVFLSKEQARKFARSIFTDIVAYVENHREELEKQLEYKKTAKGGNSNEEQY